MRAPRLIAIAVTTGAYCAAPPPPQYTSNGGPGISNGRDAGPSAGNEADGSSAENNPDGSTTGLADGGGMDGSIPDGGNSGPVFDGGLPVSQCGPDTDGTNYMSGSPTMVVAEINFDVPEYTELYNRGPGSVDLSTLSLGGSLGSSQLPAQTMGAGQFVLMRDSLGRSGEIALYSGNNLLFYVCWGSQGGSAAQAQANGVSLWSGPCATAPQQGESLHLRGSGQSAADWLALPPTPLGCSISP
jgi:hypothetical protein